MILRSTALLVCALFSSMALSQTLEFSKSAVEKYKPGNLSVHATMTLADGKTNSTVVQLQDDVTLNSLSNGNLVYVKSRREVFQVTSAMKDGDGNVIAEIKTTNLFVGLHQKYEESTHSR